MISISDNTATDALIHLLGRERVEAHAPGNRPFLTTREAFVLKDPHRQDLLERHRAADGGRRRSILEETRERDLPRADIFAGGPLALDVEWFFSARDLCDLMARVEDLPLMGINPGVADPGIWYRVAFKGGSAPGVLNLTTGLVVGAGTFHCVAAAWNDEGALDELRYWTCGGRSSPSCLRKISSVASGTSSPKRVCTASPGMRWIMNEVTMATPIRTGTSMMRRLAM